MCDGRFFVFKQKTADEMRISDWSSDVCASDREAVARAFPEAVILRPSVVFGPQDGFFSRFAGLAQMTPVLPLFGCRRPRRQDRSEEHTSELQSLMRISYAVFCLKKKKNYQ